MIRTDVEQAVVDAPSDGACCAACAVREGQPAPPADTDRGPDPGPPVVVARVPPRIELSTRRAPISRDTDRRIAFAGLLVAAAFVAAALLGLAHLIVGRTGPWIPVHLALAGGASTAVAAVLPFFSAALAAAAPMEPRVRGFGVGAVAGGALVVSIAVPAGFTGAAVVGGLTYVSGIAAVGMSALRPLQRALGVRRPLVERAYALALAQVGIGVLLAIGLVAGVPAITERWGLLKPAHAWLNVFGFLSVVIAATLVHLGPTVAGGRIRPRRSVRIAVAALLGGPPLVAVGLALAVDIVVRAGAVLETVGALALVVHATAVERDRGRWTTDRDWHRFAAGSLLLAPVWLLVAVVLASVPLLRLGADPAAWSIGRVAVPLAVGFVGQALVGSWTHLVPAIGPGDQAAHARQRAGLGRLATARLVAVNGGALVASVGAVVVGPTADIGALLLWAGLAVTAIGLATSVGLLAAAALDRRVPGSQPDRF